MDKLLLFYRYTEIGYCQVHYVCKHPNKYNCYYCLMDDGSGNVMNVKLFRCSKDGEADYPVKITPGAEIEFQIPPDAYGQKLLQEFENKA